MSKTEQEDFDTPWKRVLETYFPDFIAFCSPAMYADIDWTRQCTFLNQELLQLVRDAEVGKRHTDKLVQVWRKDGQESWVFVHVEVQGAYDANFAHRMFTYYSRIRDRYNRSVCSIAVLADDRPKWRPDRYQDQLWNCRLLLEYPTIKLADYRAHWEGLEANNNPFAMVVMTQLKMQETRSNVDDMFRARLYLTKLCARRGYSDDQIMGLYRFIEWLMKLPPVLESACHEEMLRFEEKQSMTSYTTYAERIGEERGEARGEAKGLRTAINMTLDLNYGPEADSLRACVSKVDDADRLQEFYAKLIRGASLDELRAFCDDAP